MSQIINLNTKSNAQGIQRQDFQAKNVNQNKPVPIELQNARPSENVWKRIGFAIVTIGISEIVRYFRGKNNVQVNLAAQPHFPPTDQNPNVVNNYLPQNPPNEDRLKDDFFRAAKDRKPFPNPLGNYAKLGMDNLRKFLGNDAVPKNSTVYTFFSQSEFNEWAKSVHDNFDQATFANSIFEHGCKCRVNNLAKGELLALANNAKPPFKLDALALDRSLENLKARYKDQWDSMLKTAYTKEAVQTEFAKMPDLLDILRAQQEIIKQQNLASNHVTDALSIKYGLSIAYVTKNLETTYLDSEHQKALAEFNKVLDDPTKSLKGLNEEIAQKHLQISNAFIEQKSALLDKVKDLDTPVKDALTKFILNNPNITDPKQLDQCLAAMSKINVDSLIKATDPAYVQAMSANKITVINGKVITETTGDDVIKGQLTVLGAQLATELKGSENYTKPVQDAMLELVFTGISAKNPALVENIRQMPLSQVDDIITSLSNEKSNPLNKELVQTSLDLGGRVVSLAREKILKEYLQTHPAAGQSSNPLGTPSNKHLKAIWENVRTLFNEFAAGLPKDQKATFSQFLGTLKVGTSENIPDKFRASASLQVKILNNQANDISNIETLKEIYHPKLAEEIRPVFDSLLAVLDIKPGPIPQNFVDFLELQVASMSKWRNIEMNDQDMSQVNTTLLDYFKNLAIREEDNYQDQLKNNDLKHAPLFNDQGIHQQVAVDMHRSTYSVNGHEFIRSNDTATYQKLITENISNPKARRLVTGLMNQRSGTTVANITMGQPLMDPQTKKPIDILAIPGSSKMLTRPLEPFGFIGVIGGNNPSTYKVDISDDKKTATVNVTINCKLVPGNLSDAYIINQYNRFGICNISQDFKIDLENATITSYNYTQNFEPFVHIQNKNPA